MGIYVSNLISGLDKGLDDPEFLLKILNEFNSTVGIEFFLHTHSERYKKLLDEKAHLFKDYAISTHGPFIGIEATSEKGTAEYEKFINAYQYAFEKSAQLGSKHVVFHSNERFVSQENKKELQTICMENINTLIRLAKEYSQTLLIENLGLPIKGIPIFNEEEFIELFKTFPNAGCIIDVGHIHLAKWDVQKVISSLGPIIKNYHIHNNDGLGDTHQKLTKGTFNFDVFFEIYKEFTPLADLTLEYGDNHEITADEIIHDIKFLKKKTAL